MTGAPLVFVVCGVSGCGKSTVGALLAERLGCAFYEGDAFHPPANIEKMQVCFLAGIFSLAVVQAGVPLGDSDRWPWLQQLAGIIQCHLATRQLAVLSCSALKPAYRALLQMGRCREDSRMGSEGSMGSEGGMGSNCSQQLQQQAQGGGSGGGSGSGSGSGSCRLTLAANGRTGARQESSSTAGCGDSGELVAFVLLDPPRPLLEHRLQQRTAAGAHFMPPSLLDSQLAALQYEEGELFMHVQGRPFPQPHQIVDAVLLRMQHVPALQQ